LISILRALRRLQTWLRADCGPAWSPKWQRLKHEGNKWEISKHRDFKPMDDGDDDDDSDDDDD
jgi:hypothetical protein